MNKFLAKERQIKREVEQRNLRSFKFLLLFSVLILITAQVIIMTRHLARQNQLQLQQLELERQDLETEMGQLLLEKGALSSPIRVEKLAREKLNMYFPSAQEIEILVDDIK